MAKTIITIGREYCTGGNYIAEDVANALGIKLYDKELITMAAKHSGLSEEAVAASEKRHTHSLLYSLYTMGNELPLGERGELGIKGREHLVVLTELHALLREQTGDRSAEGSKREILAVDVDRPHLVRACGHKPTDTEQEDESTRNSTPEANTARLTRCAAGFACRLLAC